MQLFSLIIRFAKFTDPIRDVTDIRTAGSGGMGKRLVIKMRPETSFATTREKYVGHKRAKKSVQAIFANKVMK